MRMGLIDYGKLFGFPADNDVSAAIITTFQCVRATLSLLSVSPEILLHCAGKLIIYQNPTRYDCHPSRTRNSSLISFWRSRSAGKLRCVVDTVSRNAEESMEARNSVGHIPCSRVSSNR